MWLLYRGYLKSHAGSIGNRLRKQIFLLHDYSSWSIVFIVWCVFLPSFENFCSQIQDILIRLGCHFQYYMNNNKRRFKILLIPLSSYHRTVFSTRNTTTPHFVYSTKEHFDLMARVFAIAGILHLMVQNVQNRQLLKELSTLEPTGTTLNVIAILKVIVTRYQKVAFALVSG